MSATTTLTYSPAYNSGADFTWSGVTFSSTDGGLTYTGSPTILTSTVPGNDNLRNVTIGNIVTSVSDYIFPCPNLVTVITYTNISNFGLAFFGLNNAGLQITFDYAGSIPDAACGSRTLMTGVTIGPNITNTGLYTFNNCTGLTSITIPNSVTTIGAQSFSYCTGLTSVIIPSSVTSVGDFAFQSCPGLTSVTVNTYISNFSTVFTETPNIQEITFDYAGAIPNGACAGKTLITSVTVGSNITSIGQNAFSGCSGLTSVTIPSSVTSVGDFAFQSCSGLISVTIPSSVTSIGQNAFERCSSLTSVTIPSSVTSVGDFAFSGCSGLTSVTVNTNITNFGFVFFGLNNAGLQITFDYVGEIPFGACNGRTLMTGVTIGPNITSIGIQAFFNCSSITSITIPSSVTSIGDAVFGVCSSLTSIGVDGGNTSYLSVDGVLFNIDQTIILCFPAGKNGPYAIPSSVTTIAGAFAGCSNLSSIIIPNSVITIGAFSFLYCLFTSIVIPNSVTTIDFESFESMHNLLSVTFEPASQVQTIGDYTFWDCSALTSITIPNSVTSVGIGVLELCISLSSITFESVSQLETISADAFKNTIITSISIPDSVTSVGSNAFGDCNDLEIVSISNAEAIRLGFSGGSPQTGVTPFFGAPNPVDFLTPPLPIISSIVPDNGSIDGDTFVTITGSNLIETTSVTFGGTEATDINIVSDNEISCKTPAHAAGLVDVIVTNDVGSATLSEGFTYTNFTITTLTYSPAYNSGNPFTWSDGTFSSTDGGLTYIGSLTIINSVVPGASNLTGITIGNIVTSVNNYTFPCPKLVTIITYTYISNFDFAFVEANNAGLQITFDYVGAIPDAACGDLSLMTGVTIGPFITSIGNNAFSRCSVLTSVTIPNSVTSIDNYAFLRCSSLTSVTIPNSVASIGNAVFNFCSGLTSVTIPNSVTSIGSFAFGTCSGLTSITIPNSVTSIDNYAFYNCSGLTSVTIPNSVTIIGDNAFGTCSGLTSVTLYTYISNFSSVFGDSSSIQEISFIYDGAIPEYACSDRSSLTSVTLGSTITSIGNNAFSNCSGLTSITITNSVTSIGNYAFYGCSDLTSVIIGDSVTSIGYAAFQSCSSLTSVTIPNSVTSIGSAFESCSGLISVTIGDSVTSIGSTAFYICSGLTTVFISDVEAKLLGFPGGSPQTGVRSFFAAPNPVNFISTPIITTISPSSGSMDGGTFVTITGVNLTGTTSVTFGGTEATDINVVSDTEITCITPASDNTGPVDVIVTNNIGSSSPGTFTYKNFTITILTYSPAYNSGADFTWSGVTFSSIDGGLTYTGSPTTLTNPVPGNNDLTGITIGNIVTSVSDYIFPCPNLVTVITYTNITNFGLAFFGINNAGLQITFDYAGSIPSGACNGRTLMTGVTIGRNITSIGIQAFFNCSSITSITIPSSVTSIGDAVFGVCSSLTSIGVDGGNTSYLSVDGVLFNIDQTIILCFPAGKNGPYTIPSSVTTIAGAFAGCSNLSSIIIPNSVITIGAFSFFDCLFTSIVIPNSVTTIDFESFESMHNLLSVTFEPASQVQTIGDYTFYNCSALTSITIPNSVTSVGIGVVELCISLSSITFESVSQLETISADAFKNTIITSIKIHNSVTSVGSNAFGDCNDLEIVSISNAEAIRLGFSGGSPQTGVTPFFGAPNPVDFLEGPLPIITTISPSVGGKNGGTLVTITGSNLIETTSVTFGGTEATEITLVTDTEITCITPAHPAGLVDVIVTNDVGPSNSITFTYDITCFKEDSKILTDKGYILVQDLRKGDLVKTVFSGFKKIEHIGYSKMYHNLNNIRSEDKLYRCSTNKYPDLIEDLIITGGHSILITNFKDQEQKEKTKDLLTDNYVTEKHYRLPACVDDKTKIFEQEGIHTIWHFSLENANYFNNYGVYANGLLVETASNRMMVEKSGFKLLE